MKIVIEPKGTVLGIMVILMASVLSAGECRWTGAAGDGRFETPGNWSPAPTSGAGDIAIFEDATGTITLPDAGFDLAAIRFLGATSPGPTLTGGELTLSGTGTIWSNLVEVTVSAPLHVTKGGTLRVEHSWTQNGLVTVDEGTFYLLGELGNAGPRPVNFNARIEAPNADFVSACGNYYDSRSAIWFNKPINVKGFYSSGKSGYASYKNVHNHFAATGNVWKTFSLAYANAYAEVANALDPTTVFSFGNYYVHKNLDSTPMFSLKGHDLQIDHVDVTYDFAKNYNGGRFTSTDAATLTCRSTASTTVHTRLQGAVSFVWDPVSDNYTNTFYNCTNSTTGALIVRRGTLNMTGAATFSSVPEVSVGEGATFEMLSTASGALGGLKRLSVAKNGRFTVGDGAVSPFGTLTFVGVGSGAKLALPAGVTLKTYALTKPDGTVVTSGTYTGEAGSSSCTRVNWIEGAGVIDVSAAAPTDANYWIGGNGSWKTASNWSKGTVPTENEATVVRTVGSPATVTIDDERALPKNLTIQGAEGVAASVSLAARVTSGKDHLLTILEDGVLSIPSGGTWYYDCVGGAKGSTTTGVNISGGTLSVEGGTATVTNFYGKITVGGNMHKTSTLAVTSGTFYLRQAEVCYETVVVKEGGLVRLTGGLMHMPSVGWNTAMLTLNGGVVEADGTAELRLGHTKSYPFGEWNGGSGALRFGDSAKMTTETSAFQMITYANGTHPFSLAFHDQAGWKWADNLGSSEVTFYGTEDAARFNVDFASDAIHQLGGNVKFPYGKGFGQFNVSEGLVRIGTIRFAIGAPAAGSRATGVVNVSGGALSVNGRHCDWAAAKHYDHFCGTVVGCGVGIATNSTSFARGTLNVSGGVVTNESFVVAGAGLAEGDIVQTGGKMVGISTVRPLVIGSAGGVGRYAITNGVSTYAHDAYVGGAPFDVLNLKDSDVYDRFNHEAVGTLSVGPGGAFTTTKTLYVGADGAGTLAVGGTGAVQAKALTVQNLRPSTLRFSFGATGITPVKVTNAAMIADGTTIEVDVTDFDGKPSGKIELVDAGTLSVDLSKATVHFVDRAGTRGAEAKLIARNGSLYAHWPRGLSVIVR